VPCDLLLCCWPVPKLSHHPLNRQRKEARPLSHEKLSFETHLTHGMLPCVRNALRSEALQQQSLTRRRTASKPTSPQPMVGLVPIAQTTGMIGAQHTLET
jgi:hypothetical protein